MERHFLELSGLCGRDLMRTQGAGGNTSFKTADVIWVKGSGQWLRSAEDKPIFLALNYVHAQMLLTQNATVDFSAACIEPSLLRPSIETAMHVRMPQRVVFHLHTVTSLSLACRFEHEIQPILTSRLQGLSWAFIPYCQPGYPLMQALDAHLSKKRVDVFVLQNHGLLLGADNCDLMRQLLDEVESRLQQPVRAFKWALTGTVKKQWGSLLARLAPVWRLPPDDLMHALACDPICFKHAQQLPMCPDHAVFLGAHAPIFDIGEISNQAQLISNKTHLIVKGMGVLVHQQIKEEAYQLLLAQAHIGLRLQLNTNIKYLSDKEINTLLNWDAEKYRQTQVSL